jgi:hypothetical protein
MLGTHEGGGGVAASPLIFLSLAGPAAARPAAHGRGGHGLLYKSTPSFAPTYLLASHIALVLAADPRVATTLPNYSVANGLDSRLRRGLIERHREGHCRRRTCDAEQCRSANRDSCACDQEFSGPYHDSFLSIDPAAIDSLA